jgi:hypothetical protein
MDISIIQSQVYAPRTVLKIILLKTQIIVVWLAIQVAKLAQAHPHILALHVYRVCTIYKILLVDFVCKIVLQKNIGSRILFVHLAIFRA